MERTRVYGFNIVFEGVKRSVLRIIYIYIYIWDNNILVSKL